MIPGETFIKDFPDAESTIGEGLCHLLPILLTLSGNKILFLTFGQLFKGLFSGSF